jgi:hypothetical protein
MGDVHEIVIAHDRYVTASVSAYEQRLDQLVAIATARTIADLSRRLTVDKNGVIAGTAANRRVLRSVDDIFMSELEDAGFSALNRSYAGQFAGQLPFLDEILDKISDSLKTPLGNVGDTARAQEKQTAAERQATPQPITASPGAKDGNKEIPGQGSIPPEGSPPMQRYSVRDVIRAQEKQTLTAQQASTVDSLQGAAQAVAAGAKRQAMFGFAGLKVSDLAATLSKSLGKTTAQAETIADTAQVMFYRTATAQAFAVIEKDLPEMKIRYEYEGPDDSLTRPFCDHLLQAAKTYTRDEIGRMNNHQLPNVLITAGGWNCRHQWMVAL